MVLVSVGHVVSTRCSCIVFRTADVLCLSVLREMIRVSVVCDMCMWGSWVEREVSG